MSITPEDLPIFLDGQPGDALVRACEAYIAEYVYSPEEFVADHEPTEFERAMLVDCLAGMFADADVCAALHALTRMRSDALQSPEGRTA